MDKKEIGIYIHIPFCESKCGYCDFVSFSSKEDRFALYKDALIKEILRFTQLKKYEIKTIFIGGGTPTVLPPYFIAEILETLYKYNINKKAEITIEANPGTLNINMLRVLKESGVNRISMGLQSWQNKLLKILGRSHRLEDFLQSYNNAIKVGFTNINVDLMFSLPEANFKDWVYTLKNIVAINPSHISIYSLIIEENTAFYDKYEDNRLILPSQEQDRRMYHFAKNYLGKNGYNQYEISNLSKTGFECKHNIIYWTRKEYKGFGLGAHSFLNGVRSNNTKNLDKYIDALKSEDNILENIESISPKDSMEEFMFLGLRLTEGVSKKLFQKEFNIDIENIFGAIIQKNISKGLLKAEKDRIFLTQKGMDISNSVMSEFLL